MSELLNEKQQIEKIQLLSERANLINQKIAALSALKSQNKTELDNAEKEAIDKFGTSDVSELRIKYKQEVTEQTQKIILYENEVSDCEKLINEIEKNLKEIEGQYA